MPILVGNPATGKVEFRARDLPMPSKTLGLVVLRVNKDVWKLYRKGDEIQGRDLVPETSERWRLAKAASERRRI